MHKGKLNKDLQWSSGFIPLVLIRTRGIFNKNTYYWASPHSFGFRPEEGLKIFLSNRFPGDADVVGPGAVL